MFDPTRGVPSAGLESANGEELQLKVEQHVQAYLTASEMHRAEREVFDAWEALTNAIGQQLEGSGREKDIPSLRSALKAAEAQAWAAVDRACGALN
jgi:hypothetical protein